MIASVAGTLLHKTTQVAVVNVQGVGYEVHVPLSTFYRLPDPPAALTLYTHTYLREDTLQLYGFLSREERDLFILLLSISGIGPKLGLNVLSAMSVGEFLAAARSGDAARFAVVPGVGKKIAARLALELREKPLILAAADVGTTGPRTARTAQAAMLDDVLSALVNLGYKRQKAEETVKKVLAEHDGDLSVEALIKESLKRLSRG